MKQKEKRRRRKKKQIKQLPNDPTGRLDFNQKAKAFYVNVCVCVFHNAARWTIESFLVNYEIVPACVLLFARVVEKKDIEAIFPLYSFAQTSHHTTTNNAQRFRYDTMEPKTITVLCMVRAKRKLKVTDQSNLDSWLEMLSSQAPLPPCVFFFSNFFLCLGIIFGQQQQQPQKATSANGLYVRA